jgi:hypothetical protein
VAWDCLHQLDAEMLASMPDDERVARWHSMLAEAQKKLAGSWRKNAIDSLLTDLVDGQPVPVETALALHGHLWAAAQNHQHKLELFEKRSLPSVTALLATAVFASLVFIVVVVTSPTLDWLRPWALVASVGVPAGALGGILSAAFSLGGTDLKASIPEMRLSRLATFTRPLLGGVVAVPILVFVHAGYLEVANLEGTLGVMAFCFLGGFSERWFLGLLESLERSRK